MKTAFTIVSVLAVVFAVSQVRGSDDWRAITPLPDDVALERIPADSSYSPKIARLSGVWHGQWKWNMNLSAGTEALAGVPVTLVIEKFFGRNVQAVYSLGAYEHAKAGWARILGVIEGNRIVFTVGPNKAKITLRLTKENSALGEWEGGGLYFKAYFDRKTLPDVIPTENEDGEEPTK